MAKRHVAPDPPYGPTAYRDRKRWWWLLSVVFPLHFVALIGCAWWVGTHALSWWAMLLMAYVAGAIRAARRQCRCR